MSSSESARSALEEQDLNKIITKTTTYAYGGPDGTRRILKGFIVIFQ